MTQTNNERVDITPLEKINAVQSIRNAETLDDALRVMNGLAANGWLRLFDNATHPDGTSYRDKQPTSQNEQQEAVAYAWEYESPDKTWKSITSNKTELQDHLEIGCTLVRELFTSPPKQAMPDGWKLIGKVSEMGVIWHKQNPHAHPCGTEFYAVSPTNTEVGE